MGIALFAVRGGDEMAIRYGRGDVKHNPSPLLKANSYPLATPIFLERTDFDYRTVAHRTSDFRRR